MSVRRSTTVCGTALAVALLASGCASGIQPRDDSHVDYSLDAHLSGTLDMMGFGLGDDVATVRDADARRALGSDVHVQMAQGALDTQAFLSAVAAGDPPDVVYASRDDIGSLATQGRCSPSTVASRVPARTPGSSVRRRSRRSPRAGTCTACPSSTSCSSRWRRRDCSTGPV